MTGSSSVAIQHILKSLERYKLRYKSVSGPLPPFFVAIQGPQGSGKTHLTRILREQLSLPPHNLNIAVLSMDDLYLNHDCLVTLAKQYPENILWAGRGQPGTHDIKLGTNVLRELFSINQRNSSEVELPVFEKSLFDGEGDRLPDGDPRNPKIKVPPRLDIIILEGWCTGFSSLNEANLLQRFDKYMSHASEIALPDDPFDRPILRKDDLLAVNRTLRNYEEIWKWFSCFIQVTPLQSWIANLPSLTMFR
jgi:D-glycerate 3-kinase